MILKKRDTSILNSITEESMDASRYKSNSNDSDEN